MNKKQIEDEQNKNKQPAAPTLDEQMVRRQSAPQPTAEEELQRVIYGKQKQLQDNPNNGVMTSNNNGAMPKKLPIGKEQIQKATVILTKYKEGKANLENKIIENEEWYKLRHWECMRDKKDDVQPVSAWLFTCIMNKHADAMDNFPSPNILPREEGDKGEAENLSAIIPVLLEQTGFEDTYSRVWDYKLKTGTGVYGVFWDNMKHNGLGDVAISKIDLLNLFWEPGITDIQKSRNVFHVELCDNEILEERYPRLVGKLGTSALTVAKYKYDDKVDTTNKSVVVDWYYKKGSADGRTVLHYCKYVNDEVLFATENDSQFAERGWYDHGLYPFVFDTLFAVEGSPCGFGFIDVGKDVQAYIDRGNQAIMKNLLANAKPRYFSSSEGGVNEQEFADTSKDIVHVEGSLNQYSVVPIEGKSLSGIYVDVINNKIEELKETTGNRDVTSGGTGGVTAASAIAAMQETGGKGSRDIIKASYRAFRDVCYQIIELIRQFYDIQRSFRIVGENGMQRFVQYSNASISPIDQGNVAGVELGLRAPVFDIEVTAQKQSPYSKMSQNELALQFFGAGFFNPQIADQALVCLDMMDFDRKHFVMQKIAQNGGMYQQMIQMQQQMITLAQMVDEIKGTNIAQQIVAGGGFGQPLPYTNAGAEKTGESTVLGGDNRSVGESTTTKKARKQAAETTSPT